MAQPLLKSIYGIFSEERTHSLKSSKEHVRTCKNIAIEKDSSS
jgi:hypothetical protein